ncbi:sugar transporter SWEET1-like [Lineus longissimus]|uniref:sugar transporter SWEET1-like n=1 Tax=Lineus longissimus TaxID=88925 RepID=UPI00315CCFC5
MKMKMDYAYLTDTVATLATLCSILQLSIGITICKQIVQKGSSSDVQFFPFLAMFSSCSVWLKYGFLKEDTALIVVNIFGMCLQFCYMTVYYSYTNQKSSLHRQMLIGVLAIFPILMHIRSLTDPELAKRRLGLYCCSMSVVSYGSPLSSVSEVIRTKNSGVMSFPLVIANVIVGVEWSLYGVLRQDRFLQVPNMIGTVLGFLQLLLFFRFPMKRARVIHKPGSLQNV